MGILDHLRRIFKKKRSTEALETIDQSLERFDEAQRPIAQSFKEDQVPKPTHIELEKESLQLGVAAGYTGRSIRGIESSLSRIESNMITKDWFGLQFPTKEDLKLLFNKLEENEQMRFETIQGLLTSLQRTTGKVPEPLRTELTEKIEEIQKQLPLTPKMEGMLLIIKEFGEIGYEDLANRLGISISALRGLLSYTVKRTDKIKRFKKNGKGWAKYTAIEQAL